ncbi:MAG: molecular chaperone DnaJ [Anaerolineae bacterium]|nr:molecular chaperone DnaJ [Anaerolineae bacterium]
MAAQKRDYYEILGVGRGATKEELKKAFHRLARQYHPDVSQEPDAEARFKEINEAYSVLNDPDKRARYDRFGHRGIGVDPGGFGGMSGFPDFEEIFADFFGGFTNVRDTSRRRRGRDLHLDLTIDFEESVFGAEKEVEINRLEHCPVCSGSGAEPGTSARRCAECNGTGQVRQVRQSLFGSMLYTTQCPRCQGRGEVVDTPCKHCNGSGKAQVRRTIKVKVPPGIDDGMQIRLSNQGEPGDSGMANGDLNVNVHVRPHQFFRRRHDDIIVEISINIAQAALGDKIMVPTVDGDMELSIPNGTQAGKVFRLRGKGVPHLRRDGSTSGRGDQLVVVQVAVPTRLTAEQRELFERLAATMGSEVITQKNENKGFFERVWDWLSGEQ